MAVAEPSGPNEVSEKDSNAPPIGDGSAPRGKEDRPRTRDETTAIVVRAQHGDVHAMDELLDLLTPYVSRLCRSIALRDGQDATQEAMFAIFRGIGQLKEPAALFGWVRAIATREAVRVVRRNTRARAAELPELPAAGSAELAAESAELAAHIKDVLRRLSPEHRAVLVLRDMEDLDEQAVSHMLGVPGGTVRSRLFRARRAFRRVWD